MTVLIRDISRCFPGLFQSFLQLIEKSFGFSKIIDRNESFFGFAGIAGSIGIESVQVVLEFKFFKKLIRRRIIEITYQSIIDVELNRGIRIYRNKLAGKIGLLSVTDEIFLLRGSLHLIYVSIYTVYTSVFGEKLCGRFGTYARNAVYIIGRIAHQSFHVNEHKRCDAVFFLNVCGIITLYSGFTAFSLGNAYPDMLIGYLQQISVSGNKTDFNTFGLTFLRYGSEHIICFISGQGLYADIH